MMTGGSPISGNLHIIMECIANYNQKDETCPLMLFFTYRKIWDVNGMHFHRMYSQLQSKVGVFNGIVYGDMMDYL